MRTSFIRYRPKSRLVILYEDLLEICDGNMLAAMLLAILIYWTDIKIAKKSETLWVWKSHEDFQEDLMSDKPGMKKPHRTTIKRALDLLKSKKFIDMRRNPKMPLDQTRQYLVNQKAVQAAIEKLPPIVVKVTLESIKDDNAKSEDQHSLSENRQSNAEKPTSNTNDYNTEITSPEITEGTYGANAPTPALFVHPEYDFLAFDDLQHPTVMVIYFVDDDRAEVTNKARGWTAQGVVETLASQGIQVQVRKEKEHHSSTVDAPTHADLKEVVDEKIEEVQRITDKHKAIPSDSHAAIGKDELPIIPPRLTLPSKPRLEAVKPSKPGDILAVRMQDGTSEALARVECYEDSSKTTIRVDWLEPCGAYIQAWRDIYGSIAYPYESSLPALPDPSFVNHGIQAFGEYRILNAPERAEVTITPIFLRESQPVASKQTVAAGQAPIVTSLPIDNDPSRQSTVSQTPGTPAPLPLAAGTADVSSRHGDSRSDQAPSRSLLLPEPAQADFPPAGSVASGATTAQVTGFVPPKRPRGKQPPVSLTLLGSQVMQWVGEIRGAKPRMTQSNIRGCNGLAECDGMSKEALAAYFELMEAQHREVDLLTAAGETGNDKVGFLSFESNWPKLKRKLAPSSGDEKSADIYTQASLDPERNQRNIDKLKQKAVQRGHIL